MPEWISGKDGEAAWEKAKAIVKSEYGASVEKSDPDKFYSLVTSVYKKICSGEKYTCGIAGKTESTHMKNLIEQIEVIVSGIEASELSESKEGNDGVSFFAKGVLPDGSKWAGGKPPIKLGYGGEVLITKKRFKGGKATFVITLRPGRGGGGGATVEAAASNYYFNLAGTDKPAVDGLKKAFASAAKKALRSIGAQADKWLSKKDNWVWRVVGWDERDDWAVKGINIASIKLGDAIVDPTRRKWPSGRTEIWIPVEISVIADMEKK